MAKKKEKRVNPPNRIRTIRESIKDPLTGKKLSQESLAEMVGTSFQQIQKLEVGKLALDHWWMLRIAPALQVEPHELIVDTDHVIAKRSEHLTKHFDLIHNYLLLDEIDRAWIDQYMKDKLQLKIAKKISSSASVSDSQEPAPSNARPRNVK